MSAGPHPADNLRAAKAFVLWLPVSALAWALILWMVL